MLYISALVYIDHGLVIGIQDLAARSHMQPSNMIAHVGGKQLTSSGRIGIEEYSRQYKVWLDGRIAAQKSQDYTFGHQTVEDATSSIVEFAQKLYSLGNQMMKHAYLCAFVSMSCVTTDGAPKGVAISDDKEIAYYYP